MNPVVRTEQSLENLLNQPITYSNSLYASRVELVTLIAPWRGEIITAQAVQENPRLDQGLNTINTMLFSIMSGEFDIIFSQDQRREFRQAERSLPEILEHCKNIYSYILEKTSILKEYQRYLEVGWEGKTLKTIAPVASAKLRDDLLKRENELLVGNFAYGLVGDHEDVIRSVITPEDVKDSRRISRITQLLILGQGLVVGEYGTSIACMAASELLHRGYISRSSPNQSMIKAFVLESVAQHRAERGTGLGLIDFLKNKNPEDAKNMLTLRTLRLLGERLEYIDKLFFSAKSSEEFQGNLYEAQEGLNIKSAAGFFRFLKGLNAAENILGVKDSFETVRRILRTTSDSK